jgi:uncharacterized alpha-E superfamily protein
MSPSRSKRSAQGLISRVADCCFWFGRYLERSESTARELQASAHLALDGELTQRQCWYPVLVVSGEEAAARTRFGDGVFEDGEQVQSYLVWDEESIVSLRRSVAAARENARSIRDVLSEDAWEAINELHLWLSHSAAQIEWHTNRDGFYRRVRQGTQLCLGLLRSTMLHDTVLDFMWLGVLLERVGQTARLLDVHHHAFASAPPEQQHQVVETAVWMALLRACSGVEPFMKAHAGRVNGEEVAHFLLGEARFPRSIAYCVHSAYERLGAIVPDSVKLPGQQALARLRVLDAWVSGLSAVNGSADMGGLHAVLTHVVDETSAICQAIGLELLGYQPAPAAGAPAAGAPAAPVAADS